MLRFQHPVLLLVAMLLLPGCRPRGDSSPAPTTPPAERSPRATGDIPGYGAGALSDIGAYLPPLDEGRLLVAPPVDWNLAPRSQAYLARFTFDRNRRLPLPRITVEGDDPAADDPRALTPENLAGYLESFVERMDEAQRQALKGDVEPLLLGDIPCARYVVRKKFRQGEKLIVAEREVLQTVRDGRVYAVLLDVHVGTLFEYRADAYAVMANMQFPLAPAPDPEKADDKAEKADDKAEKQPRKTSESGS